MATPCSEDCWLSPCDQARMPTLTEEQRPNECLCDEGEARWWSAGDYPSHIHGREIWGPGRCVSAPNGLFSTEPWLWEEGYPSHNHRSEIWVPPIAATEPFTSNHFPLNHDYERKSTLLKTQRLHCLFTLLENAVPLLSLRKSLLGRFLWAEGSLEEVFLCGIAWLSGFIRHVPGE